MLNRKYYTTPLLTDADREPVIIRPSIQPRKFRYLYIISRCIKLVRTIAWLTAIKKINDTKKAELIREMLEDFGGFWIKIGQLISMRTDLFSKEFCDTMARLQDKAYGFPQEETAAIIQEELGATIDETFSLFDPTPIAAASVAQVYKAKLLQEEKWVAVKVQRPNSERLLAMDMKLFSRLIKTLDALRLTKNLALDEMVWELNQMMTEELDFRYEASHMKRMRKILKVHKVYVPKRYKRYCSKRLIVMEWIHGVTVSEFIKLSRNNPRRVKQWIRENKIKPKKVGETLILSHLRQIFEENLYHGDLHPGNIMMLGQSKLALIDFGNIGSSDQEFLNNYKQYIYAYSNQHFSKAADLLFLSLRGVPPVDLTRLKGKVEKYLRRMDMKAHVSELPFHERSLTGGGEAIDQHFLKEGITADWSRLKIGRSIGALDMTLPFLDPKMSYYKTFAKYGKAFQKRNRKKILAKLVRLPEAIENTSAYIIPNLRKYAIKVKGDMNKIQSFIHWLVSGVSMGIWILLAFLVWTYVYQHHNSLVSEYHKGEGLLSGLVESFPIANVLSWVFVIGITLFVQFSVKKFLKKYRHPEAIQYRK